jgi:hypothetical protein
MAAGQCDVIASAAVEDPQNMQNMILLEYLSGDVDGRILNIKELARAL